MEKRSRVTQRSVKMPSLSLASEIKKECKRKVKVFFSNNSKREQTLALSHGCGSVKARIWKGKNNVSLYRYLFFLLISMASGISVFLMACLSL